MPLSLAGSCIAGTERGVDRAATASSPINRSPVETDHGTPALRYQSTVYNAIPDNITAIPPKTLMNLRFLPFRRPAAAPRRNRGTEPRQSPGASPGRSPPCRRRGVPPHHGADTSRFARTAAVADDAHHVPEPVLAPARSQVPEDQRRLHAATGCPPDGARRYPRPRPHCLKPYSLQFFSTFSRTSLEKIESSVALTGVSIPATTRPAKCSR